MGRIPAGRERDRAWLDAARTTEDERRLNAGFLLMGMALSRRSAYAASFLPPIYAQTSLLDDVADVLLPAPRHADRVACRLPMPGTRCGVGGRDLQEFGRASLFVYWIHVELAYGVLSGPWHKSLTLGQAFVAYVLFSVALFGAVEAARSDRGLVERPGGCNRQAPF